MAMHDIDKESGTRANPRINADDNVSNRMSHNTMGNTYRTTGVGVTQRMVFKNGLILTYDVDDKISSVYGYVPEISEIPIFVIALPGYDVFADILEISAPEV